MTNTSVKMKEAIKKMAYIDFYSAERIISELGVTNRTVIMALREESAEQFKTKFYMQALNEKRADIVKIIESYDLENVTTMSLLKLIDDLTKHSNVLSYREQNVYGSVLS